MVIKAPDCKSIHRFILVRYFHTQGVSFMQCPRTGSLLKTVKLGKIEIEISEKCAGIFFDNLELERFDEQHEIEGEVLIKHLSQFKPTVIKKDARINCPKCEDIVMMRRFYSPKHIVEVDECPGCAGIWLDAGELDLIRKHFSTESERLVMCDQLTKEVDRHPDVLKQRKEYDQRMSKLEIFSKVLNRLVSTRY